MTSPIKRVATSTLLLALPALLALSPVSRASAAQYVVGGFALDQPVQRNRSDYRAYTCRPSEDFENYTLCRRTERVSTSQGKAERSSTVLHAKDGTAVYLMTTVAPVAVDRHAIEKEIRGLSRKFGERPAQVDWQPERSGVPSSIIVIWGRIRLYRLKVEQDERDSIRTARDIMLDLSPGLLVDPLGDPVRSVKAGLPVYRLAGGAGYLYSASFDRSGRGHRLYLAADISHPAIERFEPELRKVLQEDQSHGSDDLRQWPALARAARNIALLASPEAANEELDKLFNAYRSRKLRSHVWPFLPLGTISSLEDNMHWTASTYGAKTEHPEIRNAIVKFLAANPSEPFSEFLYYTIGEFDKARRANPHSPIGSVIAYATGFRMFGLLLQDAARAAAIKIPDIDSPADPPDEPINEALVTLNQHPERYGDKLLGRVVPDFGAKAAAAQPWFEAVLRDQSSPQRDDAAYMLGWLAFHQGKMTEALGYLGQAMTLGNRDYKLPAAVKETVRVLSRFPPREQARIVASSPIFSAQPALWYVAARSAYREFDYDLAIETGEHGLNALGLPAGRLPLTTDPERIKEAVEKNIPAKTRESDDFDETDLTEIPYIVEASREIVRYNVLLKSVDTARPDIVTKRAREIIQKYSLLLDVPERPNQQRASPGPAHKDLRQAVRLIDVTLRSVPRTARYAALREWLYYRKVRILVQFDPGAVAAAVKSMAAESPKSSLMDDALAEQIYAEGIMMKDVAAAERTFHKLVENFPNGNAVDNAYSWMAIIYRCAGKVALGQKMNLEIIRLFPLTRHARYARERMAHPARCKLNEASQEAGERP